MGYGDLERRQESRSGARYEGIGGAPRVSEDAPEGDAPGVLTRAQQLTALAVRLIGMFLLVVGVWLAVQVADEAWQLYQDPERVERFALAVERGSHIDAVLAPPEPAPGADATTDNATGTITGDTEATARAAPAERFRLSYFVAWAIAIALLFLVGRIAVWLVKTGGELALYDMRMRRFARHMASELRGKGG